MSAADFLPAERTFEALRVAAAGCRGCELYQRATRTVLGEGLEEASLLLVGEQPGNEEDLEGRPFVGPAGRILDEACEAAEIDREDVYVTNVVKHFKWEPRGRRRLHKKPNAREIRACLPWLEAEIELVRPEVVVCLGATAAQAILGRDFKVTLKRGLVVPTRFGLPGVATVHPASILRQPTSEDRHREMELLIEDLRVAGGVVEGTTRTRRRG